MARDFKPSNSQHRKHTSKKYRKLSSSDDEQSKDRVKQQHNCACHISYNNETTNTTLQNNATLPVTPSLRKRMISIMGPSTVSNGNLATILSTDTSELYQPNSNKNKKTCSKHLDRKSHTEPRSRSKAKKCSKLATAVTTESSGRHYSKQHSKPQRSNSCSRVNNSSPPPLPRRNNNCRRKVRHQCSKPPVKPPANIPKCPGCMKEFKSPILLSCGHSLCKRCVTTFVSESDGTSFKCPSCETQIKLTGDEEELFCPNFIILRQTEFGMDNDDEESQDLLCAVCQSDYEADFYCDTCRDLLCHNCADAHQIVKYTRDHRIRDIDCSTDVSSLVKKRYYCADHEDDVVDTYCVPCQKCVCKKCAHLYHRSTNHHCLPVSAAAGNVREEIRRQLFEFKSRAPNLQLALMDLQRAKRNLKEQANVTYAEITESMARLTASLKEHEKKLHKRLEDVCQTKVSALKVQKRKIVVQLERFESLGSILEQLDHHGNNIETLQMRSAIRECANFLERDPYGMASTGSAGMVKNSIFFNSNEIKIKREVAKHGEIFHFTSSGEDTKCPLVKPQSTNNIPTDNTCCYHIVSNFEERVSVMTLLGPQATNELSLRKNAKRIRAKSNWMILKSRLPDVIKNTSSVPANADDDRRTPRRVLSSRNNLNMKRSSSRKREVSRAKKQKARANWMILRSHLSDLTTDTDTTPGRRLKKKEPFLFKRPHSAVKRRPRINNRKVMRVKALRKRANANWLLVRSKIPDIVDYGRVTGRTFRSVMFRAPSSSLISHFRRKRSSPTIMRLKCFRAKKLRAQANWLLVASRAHDIARYPEKMRNQQRKQQRSSWDTYLEDLNKNRRKATRNKYVAGVLRARANWMLVRSRIPDIIFYGKYQRYTKKTPATTTVKSPVKQQYSRQSRHEEDNENRSTNNRSFQDFIYKTFSPQVTTRQRSPTKHTPTDKDLKTVSKRRRDEDNNKEKPRRSSKHHHHHSHRHHHYRSSTKINKSPRSTLTKKRKGITQTALENWSRFIESAQAHQNRTKDSHHNKKFDQNETGSNQEAVYKNWDDLLKGDIRNSSCRKHSSPSHKKKLINDAALHHWDNLTKYTTTNGKRKPNKNKAEQNLDHLTKNTPGEKQQKKENNSKAHQNWDHLTKNTPGQKLNNTKAHQNWDQLIKNTPGEKPQKSNNSKAHQHWDHLTKNTPGQKSNNTKAHQNWDHLIKNTSGEKPQKSNNSKAHQNWDHLTRNTQAPNEDTTYHNWDTLIQNTAREIKEKSSLRSHDAFMNWDNLVRFKTAEGNDPKKSYAEWDRLVDGTSTISPSRHAQNEDKISRQQLQQQKNPNNIEDPQSIKHWRHLVDSAKREKRNAQENWRQLTGNSQRERETAERHWTELVRSTKINPDNHRRSSKKHKNNKRQSVKKGWDKIRTSLGRNLTPQIDSSQPVLGTAHQERAYKNWWALVSGSSDNGHGEGEDIREKAVRTNQLSEAIQNWNTLLQGTDTPDVTASNGKAMEHWHQLVSGTKVESIDEKQQIVNNWHNLILHTDITNEREEACANWHRLIQSTKPTSTTTEEATPQQHWHNLIHATGEDTPAACSSFDSLAVAHYNWDKLIEGRIIRNPSDPNARTPSSNTTTAITSIPHNGSSLSSYQKIADTPPPGFRLLFDKNRAIESGNHEPKVMRLNIRNDLGQFDDVRLKMTSPNKSMLSAHLKENSDGTFTIFCCPSVDEPFDIAISLSGSKMKKETQVLTLKGDLSMFKKSPVAARIACRTISLIRWHLTPGLLQRQGERIVPGK